MPNIKEEEKTITIKLSRFLDYALGNSGIAAVRLEEAKLISLIDSEEQYVHVQYTDLDTGSQLVNPQIYSKKKWLTESKRIENNKKIYAIRREITDRQKHNIEHTAKLIANRTKLPIQQSLFLATRMVVDGDSAFLKQLGIDIKEITESEKKEAGTYIIIDEKGKERKIL